MLRHSPEPPILPLVLYPVRPKSGQVGTRPDRIQETDIKYIPAIALLLMIASPAPAQAPAGPVAFAAVTGVPTPFQSVSGRFSSLNPVHQHNCLTGQVTRPRRLASSDPGGSDMSAAGRGNDNVLVNVEFEQSRRCRANDHGTARDHSGQLQKRGGGPRSRFRTPNSLIAEKAVLVSSRPDPAPPAPAFTSYMMCQPPELDALASKLGHDLCVQNTIVANLGGMGPALESAARAPAKLAPEDAVPGDPNAISCRLDPGRFGSSLAGHRLCPGQLLGLVQGQVARPLYRLWPRHDEPPRHAMSPLSEFSHHQGAGAQRARQDCRGAADGGALCAFRAAGLVRFPGGTGRCPETTEIIATLLPDAPTKRAVEPLPPFLAHLIRPRAEKPALPVFTIATGAPPQAPAPLAASAAKTSPHAGRHLRQRTDGAGGFRQRHRRQWQRIGRLPGSGLDAGGDRSRAPVLLLSGRGWLSARTWRGDGALRRCAATARSTGWRSASRPAMRGSTRPPSTSCRRPSLCRRFRTGCIPTGSMATCR